MISKKEKEAIKKSKKKSYEEKEWYTCRSLLGNQWAN